MLSSLCVFLAGKIDYQHHKYEDIMRFYYANRKGPKGRVKPFESIMGELKEDFIDLEFKILITIQFDFEFDSPFEHVRYFKHQYWTHRMSKLTDNKENKELIVSLFENFIELTKKFLIDSYIHPFCLYFPAPIIAASCLIISASVFNKQQQIIDKTLNSKKRGEDILSSVFNLPSLLGLTLYEDHFDDRVLHQNHDWLNFCNCRQRPGEIIDPIDVLFLANEITVKLFD